MKPFTTPAILLLSLVGATAAPAAVYRCAGVDGTPQYTQFPCGSEAEVVLESLQIIEVPPLSAAEQALLDDLQRERVQRERARDAARRQAARAAGREQAARAKRCDAARAQLDALARQRRKGYTLQEARELERREAELETEQREACR